MTIVLIVCAMFVLTPLALFFNYRMSLKDPNISVEQVMLNVPYEYFHLFLPFDDSL